MSDPHKELRREFSYENAIPGGPWYTFDVEKVLREVATLRAELAAAREALSNANERALTYDDELRTLRHRAERMGRVIKHMRRYLPVPGELPGENRISVREWEALMAEIEALDDASAGEP